MSSSSQPSPRILIVEDNELDALLLQEALKKAAQGKVELMIAGLVGDAIKLLGEHRFDVILSDLTLPDGSGLDTFTRIHAHAPDTPIILLTGYESENLGLEAVRRRQHHRFPSEQGHAQEQRQDSHGYRLRAVTSWSIWSTVWMVLELAS